MRKWMKPISIKGQRLSEHIFVRSEGYLSRTVHRSASAANINDQYSSTCLVLIMLFIQFPSICRHSHATVHTTGRRAEGGTLAFTRLINSEGSTTSNPLSACNAVATATTSSYV